MKFQKKAMRIFIIVVLSLFALSFTGGTQKETYTGYAYQEGTDKLIYTEEFTDMLVDGELKETTTRYFNPENKLIARRKLNFTVSKFAPDFLTEDMRSGCIEGATTSEGMLTLFFKKDTKSLLKKKVIKVPPNLVIDGGFNQFIKANWDGLQKDNDMTFHFAVSARLDVYLLRVNVVSVAKNVMIVKIVPDNMVLQLFASPIIVRYDINTKRILSYEGKSNIADEKGINFMTKLIYPEKGP